MAITAPTLAHAERPEPTAAAQSTTEPPPATPAALWPRGPEVTVDELAQGRTLRGSQDVVVVEVTDPAAVTDAALAATSRARGQIVWTLPSGTAWSQVVPRLADASSAPPIVRLSGDVSPTDAAAAAREIRAARSGVRVEWVAPAGVLPGDVPDAATVVEAVDLIGLTVPADEPWPTTMRRLEAWTTWAAQHRTRIAIVHDVDDTTLPGAVRSLQDWTGAAAKSKRVAYVAAHVDGDGLAATRAREGSK